MSLRSVLLAQPMTLGQVLENALLADRLGYDRVWIAETTGPDAFTAATLVANMTKKVEIGTAILPVFTRSAPVIAMSAASISFYSKRNFNLGVGSGGQLAVENWHGADFIKPVLRVKETVQVVRQVLDGTKTGFKGELISSSGFTLGITGPYCVRVYVGGLGPQMTQMAKKYADGIILTWIPLEKIGEFSDSYTDESLDVKSNSQSFDLVFRVLVAVTDDVKSARECLREVLPCYMAVPGYAQFFQSLGFEDEIEYFRKGFVVGDRDATRRAISDRMLDSLLLAGSADYCRQKLNELDGSRVGDLMIAPFVEMGDRVVYDTVSACRP